MSTDNGKIGPNDANSNGTPLKVAVVGAGVAGLGAAWHLSTCENVEVTVLESGNRAGGHANTIDIKLDDGEIVPVDTGFMVFNRENYPNVVGLFKELGVDGEDTDMSFSVSLDDGAVEWGSKGLLSLFARKRNAFSWSFHSMLREMARFNREAPLLLLLEDDDPRKAVSLREYLKMNGFSEPFARCYLVPMAAALWSSTAADVMGHSALAMISFFHNHQMLQVLGRPQWMTPAGRSRQYVEEICRRIGEDNIELDNACVSVVATKEMPPTVESPTNNTAPMSMVTKSGHPTAKSNGTPTVAVNGGTSAGGGEALLKNDRTGADGGQGRKWEIKDSQGNTRLFDQVIFACPADTALGLLGQETSSEEKDALARFEFSENIIYVHSDKKLMPSRRAAWSAWNYIGTSPEIQAAAAKGQKAERKPVFVTYWLNKLQNLTCSKELFVSLNPSPSPEPSVVHEKMRYRHPQFSPRAEKGQKVLSTLDGRRGLWFCGAWRGYGFHEDGLRSGLEAATTITGRAVPWMDIKPSTPTENVLSLASKPGLTSTISTETLALRDIAQCVEIVGNKNASRASHGLVMPQPRVVVRGKGLGRRVMGWAVAILEAVAVRAIVGFLRRTVIKGCMTIVCPDGRRYVFGDVTTVSTNDGDGTATDAGRRISLKVFDWWFFVRVAMEYDLGLARSYIAGEWELIGDNFEHDGLRQLFLFFVDNRDVSKDSKKGGMKAGKLLTSWVGYGLNYLRYKLSMDNSLSGSRSNIEAHYDLSNDLFKLFLDKDYMLYSCGIFDAEMGRYCLERRDLSCPTSDLALTGTLEKAQERKADALIARARLSKHHRLLDIGFGWGGISIRAAETVGCRVHGITLSKEQKALAEEKVIERGLQGLVTFELVDYRDFAKQHPGEFDRIISCEMIEAVGHNYLGTFFAACDGLLAPHGIMVMQAITTPENRYEEYIKSTDFINTIVFPGSCCPSLNALLEAMASKSSLSLEGLDNICVHYARTLKEWRHRFNHSLDKVAEQGFDSAFVRCFNYYFAYCEAGFASRTEGCQMLTFARPGTAALDSNAVTSVLAR